MFSDGSSSNESAMFDPTFTLSSTSRRPQARPPLGPTRLSTSSSSFRNPSQSSAAGAHRGSKASSQNEDLMLERRFGLRNEFGSRSFGQLETFSFALTIISVSSCVATTLDTPLLLGGPASVVWCWALGGIMNMSIALSLSELISAFPTAGGLYSASAWLVPRRHRAVVGWVCGYMNTIGQVAGVASTEMGLSNMIWGGVLMMKDGQVEITPLKQYGLYAALLLVHGILNSLRTSQLAAFTRGFVFINVAISLIIPLMLVFLTPISQMNSAKVVFTQVNNGTAYSNPMAFLLGLLSIMWTETDYDAVAHISFEVKQAAMTAPAALSLAVAVTGVLGFMLNVALMFTAPADLSTLPGVSNLSFLQILLFRIGKSGALLLWVPVCLVAFFTVHVALHANSRSVYAFSRDRAFPDKGLMGKLNGTTKTPLWAVWSLIVGSLGLGGLIFLSREAANAVFSMCAVALDLSYVIPVVARRLYGNHPEVNFRPGPFSLGQRTSLVVNVVMVVWTLFACVILCIPTVHPVTAKTFNYSWVITLGVLLLSLIWFYARAHKTYTGPQRDIPSPSLSRAMDEDAFRNGTRPPIGGVGGLSQFTAATGSNAVRQTSIQGIGLRSFGSISRQRFNSRGSGSVGKGEGGEVVGIDPPLLMVQQPSTASNSPRLEFDVEDSPNQTPTIVQGSTP